MKLYLHLLVIAVGLSSACAYLHKSEFHVDLLRVTTHWHDQCIPITGASQKMIDDMKVGIFTEDEKIKRYTFCLWMVSGVMSTEDYSINHDLLKELIPSQVKDGRNIYKRCEKQGRNSGKTEGYEMIWEMMKCVQKANPDTFIMF